MHHLDRVGLQAVPIILLITFLIGGIIAQQGFFHFRKFGAETYVVDMLGILILREIGVLIVSIMVAGRSGSSYTAELGSMKMREEIDALRTMGLDPIEVLVLPRVFALILALTMLTFLGSMAALYGGGLVAWFYGGMSPDIFIARLKEAISLTHFKVGMIKAPFMALVIGVVACAQGFAVKGSAELLGLQTTASVVKAIFLVIVLDGLFAMFFAQSTCEPMTRQRPSSACATSSSASASRTVLDRVSVEVKRGEIFGFVGGSGSGKSVLLRTIIGLIPARAGSIEVLGTDLTRADEEQRRAIERRWGVLFQQGALFSSLSVLQNVQFPMREYLQPVEAADAGDGGSQARHGGLAARGLEQAALRALRRHGQARGAGARPRPRPRARVPRRAHLRARSHLGRRIRRADPHPAADARAHRLHDHPRPGKPLHRVRPHRGAGRRQGGRIGPHRQRCSHSEHPWVQAYFKGKRADVLARRLAQPQA